MKETKFRDFKGFTRKRYDREEADTDESVTQKIEYPKRVQITIDCGAFAKMLPTVDIATFKANLHKYKPLSVVNYGDMRYSSVIAEERYD